MLDDEQPEQMCLRRDAKMFSSLDPCLVCYTVPALYFAYPVLEYFLLSTTCMHHSLCFLLYVLFF